MLATRKSRGVASWVVSVGAGLALALGAGGLRAQEEADGLTIGTYDPSRVAQEAGLQQQMMQRMQGLQQRMSDAQKQRDQQAMQQIQGEAEQIQQDMMGEFQQSIEDVMPQVAEEAGVQIIAVEVTYTDADVTEKDVTDAVIAQLGSAEDAE